MWGMIMDVTPGILLLAPLLFPIVKTYGIDPIHFGVVFTLNLIIGMITPPYGTGLFTGNIISDVPLEKIILEILPFTAGSIIVLFIISFFPDLVMYLPVLFDLHR
jgi:TRAP-type C4-dicarboxylate transport system permease large subunit